ncbi:rod shape-determining protein MreC [Thermosulfurimonas sp. F29]|uniref:rod shape-determining protein MreC n=1 Tax=Thermosulfurimonas sp. F29 TaxID=2867247 RepID=UPI001C8316B5|nr:rod shape-determining protein MreC [Thermosulfurimonas sp. F29]MBX6422669.1 rod shape-determining protein MreC [Thermosulfurimonas sp. F29]
MPLFLIFGVGIFSLFLILDLHPPRLVLGLLGPVLKVTSYLGNTFREGFDHYVYLVRVKQENRILRSENERLRNELVRLREEMAICQGLEALEKEKLFRKYPYVPARVIYNPLDSFEGYLIIDRGEKDQVKPESPVVTLVGDTPGVLVGQVVEVAAHYARVLPIVSPESGVEVYSPRSGERGILKGQGLGRPLLLDYVPYGTDFREGDLLLTAGTDALYPPGIRAGKIIRILPRKRQGFFQTIEARPLVNIRKLRYVAVLITSREYKP